MVIGQDPDRQRLRPPHHRYGRPLGAQEAAVAEKICDDGSGTYHGTTARAGPGTATARSACVECYDDPFARHPGAHAPGRLVGRLDREGSAGALLRRGPQGRPAAHLGAPRGSTARCGWTSGGRYAPGQPDVLSNGPLDPGIHGGVIVGYDQGHAAQTAPQIVWRRLLGAGVPAGYDDRAVGEGSRIQG